jgi:rfaE bifunctional protein kinase chain/domain
MIAPKPERLDEILGRAASVRVVVVGDLMLDEYLIGNVSRISPEAPVPVVHVTEHRVALGGAANVAANVAALGASCDLVGFVGRDTAGARMREALAPPIVPHLVERDDRPTTTKTRIMARHQQVVRYDHEDDGDLPDDSVKELVTIIDRLVSGADALILEDYNKGVLVPRVIEAALAGSRRAGIPSVVDPKFRRFFGFQGATVFKPNLAELGTALAEPVRPDDAVQMERARRLAGATNLLLTLGEHGMALHSEGTPLRRVAALSRDVYDVSGAGDTVTAYVATMLGAGATVDEAAWIANCAAAVGVTRPGVVPVSPAEVRDIVERLALASHG